LKRTLKSGTRSYYQKRGVSQERILNQKQAGAYEGGGLGARASFHWGGGSFNIISGDLLKKPWIFDFAGSTFKAFHYIF